LSLSIQSLTLFIVILRDANWNALKIAMANQQEFALNLKDGMRFRLNWEKNIFHNPISGTQQEDAWRHYKLELTGPLDSHVQLSDIVFLVQPPPGNARELGVYINQVVSVLERGIPKTPITTQESPQVGRQVVLEMEIPKCEGWLKMTVYPSADGLPAHQMLTDIARLVLPPTLSRIKMQLFISVWGYQAPPPFS
jgi:hypothetical protein